jgi:membrane-associated phospholipid phosphatase
VTIPLQTDDIGRATPVTMSYLLVTAALVVIFRRSVDSWAAIATAHVAVCVALAWLDRIESPSPVLRAVRDWHPIILFPLLYKEVELLARGIGNWRLTEAIPALEATLFGGQPSLFLSQRWHSVALSEYLHFCYLSYVLVIPGVAAYWYASRRRSAFHELVLLLAVTLFGSYLFFVLFPVDSPYYRSGPLGPPLAGHVFYDLVHQMAARGGARGGAFPSAHVSGAVVTWLVAWRHQRRLAVGLAPVVGGVIVATVYGRFHYALDTIAGLLVAVAVVAAFTGVPPRVGAREGACPFP